MRGGQQSSNPTTETAISTAKTVTGSPTKEPVKLVVRASGVALTPGTANKTIPSPSRPSTSKAAQKSPSHKRERRSHRPSKADRVLPTPNIAERPRRVVTPRPIIRNDFAQSDYKPLHDFWSASDDPDKKRNQISFQNPEIEIPQVR